jgi:hypothetical protein
MNSSKNSSLYQLPTPNVFWVSMENKNINQTSKISGPKIMAVNVAKKFVLNVKNGKK